jgi:hypothetical protein
MIFEQQIQGVDPSSLAIFSGMPKIPRMRAPTPPVIRPHLLTEQLRGACPCGTFHGLPPDYGALRGKSLRGLGDAFVGPIDPNTFDMNALQVPSIGTGATSVLQTMAVGANFVPGVGQIASVALTTFNQFLNQFETWFHLGAGRREADMITPTQNSMMASLGNITNQILTGQNPGLDTLSALYRQVWIMGVAFMEFVLQRQFVDRRASGQALNTVMPYIDGTCGYAVPAGFTETPGQSNCISWGDGTIGGVGRNGMLGAIARAITTAGGTPQALPNLETSANQGIQLSSIPMPGGIPGLPATIMGISTPYALMIGIGALYFYKRGSRRG